LRHAWAPFAGWIKARVVEIEAVDYFRGAVDAEEAGSIFAQLAGFRVELPGFGDHRRQVFLDALAGIRPWTLAIA
jgi:hypothetical protein